MKRLLLAVLTFASAPLALAAEANPLDALRLEDLSATRDRPLFSPTRRAPPPARVEAAPAPEPAPVEEKLVVLGPPPFELVGAVVGDRTAFALLRNKETAKVVRVRAGDEAEGWRVDSIGLRTIALAREGRKETLALAAPQPLAAGSEIAGESGPTEPVSPPSAAETKRDLVKSRRDQ